ncbi:conserved hypothetical protein [uncultured Dysgonomonas sp.]|uniref:BT-3987-like N-terminal domain-containing protein n=1 Tax=uncultured Dysgonomonas sp. TaxID=206096 RepID=A0A212JJZ9_9BACT|nr:DUF1735 and LamG domain-containing protein [uncultured Dysgonomonas sp.]SBV99718.1 conserved hypothetical protein [uncultured Dysgonomonas sp.]
MKLNNIIILSLCAIILMGCKDNEDYRDVIYMSGVENSVSRLFTVDPELAASEIAFNVSSSDKMAKNMIVDLKADLSLIDSYNNRFMKNYKPLPEGSYKLSRPGIDANDTNKEGLSLNSNQVLIKSGSSVSTPMKLSISDLSKFEEGVTYVLPVSIVSNNLGMSILRPSATIYFVINQTIVTKAAVLTSNYLQVDFSKNKDISLTALPAVTYETRIYVNKFQSYNPYISSVMGLEENFLLRFGDTSIKPNQLQIAKPGIASKTEFSTEKWFHIAAVFEGGNVRMYVNGELESSGNIAGVTALDLTHVYGDPMFMIGRSAKGRGIDGAVSEMRVWKKALSPADLINNMCYVDPTTPGLVAYWRFNGADDKKVTDLTGNGYDAMAAYTLKFMDHVRCPE